MVVRLKGRSFDICFIQCYAPTADNTDDEVEKFMINYIEQKNSEDHKTLE